MPSLPPKHSLRPAGQAHRSTRYPRTSARERGYTARWERERLSFIADNPLCLGCKARGAFVPTTVVDHIVPHRGDETLFWDRGNWQPSCRICHDRTKARLETMWDRGAIAARHLRLDSPKAIEIGRQAHRTGWTPPPLKSCTD